MGDNKDNEEGMGFSGISSLLPDDPPDTAAPHSALPAGGGNPQQVSTAWPTGEGESTQPQSSRSPSPPKPIFPPTQQPAPQSRRGGAIWAWIGIAVVVFVIWVASQSGTQPAGQPANQQTVAQGDSGAQSSFNQYDEHATNSNPNSQSSTAGQGEPILQAPPIGSGNILSVAEIRYCLALQQRLEGAKPVVNTYDQGQVDRFNAMVDDYNGRCKDSHQYADDFEQAKRDMTPFSDQLQAQGRQAIQGGETGQQSNSQSTAGDASRQTVLYVQRTLNALGYKAGAVDGAMGDRTRTAIEQFQRDKYLPADGLITDSLIDHLHAAEILLPHHQLALSPSTPDSAKILAKKAVAPVFRGSLVPQLVHAQMVGSCNPAYPTDAARSAETGTTILIVRVGTDGGVTAVNIASSSGSTSLDRAAVSAMEQCRFTPATREGQPVNDELRIPVSFNFERSDVRSHAW